MAASKLNLLHWHLVDDQGWRLRDQKYPRLTEIGALARAGDRAAARRRCRANGGFYTPGPGPRDRRLCRGAPHHHRAGDRDAGPRPGRDPRLSARSASARAGAAGGRIRLGRLPIPLQCRRHDLRLPRGRARRGDGAVPRPLHPRRRRRGGEGPVEGRSAQSRRRCKALGLADEDALQGWFVERIERIPGGARAAADRLGRDLAGRRRAGRRR